jgi:hypothetical protein
MDGVRQHPARNEVAAASYNPVTPDGELEQQHWPWPAPGRELVTDAAPDWHNLACLNWTPNTWPGYVEGFRRGARHLVEQVDRSGRDQDYLVFPILFLYRHYLELQLKRLISRGRQLLDLEEPTPRSHDLWRLWQTCRTILDQVSPGDAVEELNIVGEHIRTLAAIDPTAQAFRYPVDTRGQPSLPKELTLINLRHFSEQMEAAANLLGAAGDLIGATLDDKLDYERYMAAAHGPDADRP